MLSINMEDVIAILEDCRPYLIAIAVLIALAVAAIAIAAKWPKEKRTFIRLEACIALILSVAIVVNLICIGPMSTILTLVSGNGVVSDETTNEAAELCEKIADEGIVLLKNDNILPLSSATNVNVFGWASSNPVFGGAGSGSTSDAYDRISLIEGLENAGYKTNSSLFDFYQNYCDTRPDNGHPNCDWTLPEPPVNTYGDDLINEAKEFSDIAVLVYARAGAEGIQDLPTDVNQFKYTNNSTEYNDYEDGEHILQLSRTERDLLDLVCDNFDKVIVVCNSANVMELGIFNEYEQVKNVLWCPGTGQSGFNALGSIIRGTVNPSGKTADIFPASIKETAYFNNIGSFVYDNMAEFPTKSNGADFTPTFVNYVEGIYVGYHFYETAATEGLLDYDDAVVYPFGYGMSYTTFEQKIENYAENNGTISFDVVVTNTGSVAGKDVVEVYYDPPYYNGGIEKSSANLVSYEKTDLLEPNASQTIAISFNVEDMASYDTHGYGCYVLEEGEYVISINADSHHQLDSVTYTVEETTVYDEDNPRSTDKVAAVNQFQDEKGEGENVVYLSRADGFKNFEAATSAPTNYTLSDEYKATFYNISNYDPIKFDNSNDSMPTTGAQNGLSLIDLRGADFDDPRWDKLLDQMTIDEMNDLIALGGFQTVAIDSIGKLATIDCDGPASINNNFTGVGSIGFPSAVMIASTWNKELAKQFGASIGKMADEMGVSGWYAPGVNTHRSAFGARNFEYYSEDGYLSGMTAANAVEGAAQHGVYAYLKHYALNDQETNRVGMLCTWCTEQAIRETYLKPFEIAIKVGGAKGMMSAFNYIGNTWASGHYALCTAVPRFEWGFNGVIITDFFSGRGFMTADQAIRGGTDLMLVNYRRETNYVEDMSATSVQAMRTACKHILYTIANSRIYNEENLNAEIPAWKIIMVVADVAIAAGLIAWEVLLLKKKKASNTAAK